jgi:hypothetical protein
MTDRSISLARKSLVLGTPTQSKESLQALKKGELEALLRAQDDGWALEIPEAYFLVDDDGDCVRSTPSNGGMP